jgi:hypothetical protein
LKKLLREGYAKGFVRKEDLKRLFVHTNTKPLWAVDATKSCHERAKAEYTVMIEKSGATKCSSWMPIAM